MTLSLPNRHSHLNAAVWSCISLCAACLVTSAVIVCYWRSSIVTAAAAKLATNAEIPETMRPPLERAARLAPFCAEPLLFLGLSYDAQARGLPTSPQLAWTTCQAALDYYAAAARLNPADARPHHCAGWLLAWRASLDEKPVPQQALDELRKAAKLDKTEPYYRFALGYLLLKSGRTHEAIVAFAQAADFEPGYAPAICEAVLATTGDPSLLLPALGSQVPTRLRAVTFLAGKSQKPDALRLCTRIACDAVDECTDSKLRIFAMFQSLDEPLIAITFLEKWCDATPTDIQLLSALAQAKAHLGNVADAESIARRLLVLSPRNALCHTVLAEILMHKKEFAAAARELKEAISLDAFEAKSHEMLIKAYRRARQTGNAIAACKAAARIFPTTPNFPYILAQMYEEEGYFDLALKNYELSLSLQPDNPIYAGAVSRMRARLIPPDPPSPDTHSP